MIFDSLKIGNYFYQGLRLEPPLITNKLESLRRCLYRVQTRCPTTGDNLRFDLDAQDIVALNLTRASQLAVDIGRGIVGKTKGLASTSASATFVQRQVLGIIHDDLANRINATDDFQALVLHNPEAIHWETVFFSMPSRLEDFKKFAQAVDDWLSQQPPNAH